MSSAQLIHSNSMNVVKRDGRKERVHFDKITSRISKLCYGLNSLVDPIIVAQRVCSGVYNGVTTIELDELAAETAYELTNIHNDYNNLGGRLLISNLHKQTGKSFSTLIAQLAAYVHPITGQPAPLITNEVARLVAANAELIDAQLVHERDFSYDYFSVKTLMRSYLLKMNDKIAERPQHMLMRVAIGIHHDDFERVFETYRLMSLGYYTHATPTLFNAATPNGGLSSCFLVCMKSDSISGIYDTLKQCALISKQAGGIGLSVSNIRASGSYIAGTNGNSNGLLPMLKVFNETARYVDQGGGKRKGSIAIYLEPWHADILTWIHMRRNTGAHTERAHDLFYGLWIPDLFMQRVEADENWSLFCPHKAPGLQQVYGDEFKQLYEQYEAKGLANKVVKARDIWIEILVSQQETGGPYMLYKDAANLKNNQKHVGPILSSNLCVEILEVTNPNEVAVCNLASVAVNKFVLGPGQYDFQGLHSLVEHVTRSVDCVIDRTTYAVPEAKYSNLRHRPMGIGIQGFADAMVCLRYTWDSPEGREFNRMLWATMYHASLTSSKDLAVEKGPYETFAGSEFSHGRLQFDLWGAEPHPMYDWDTLKQEIQQHGTRNSLLLAPMPTASTAHILGNNEGVEPFSSLYYLRRVLAVEAQVLCKHLVRDLCELKLWDAEMRQDLVAHKGSIQSIARIPQHIKDLYKTSYELSAKLMLDYAADRGIYIDQGQSQNCFMETVNTAKLTSMHMYAWKKGLKSGMYYLRSKPASDPIQVTVDPRKVTQIQKDIVCSLDNREECLSCGA